MSEEAAELFCPMCAATARPIMSPDGPVCSYCETPLRPREFALDLESPVEPAAEPPGPSLPHPGFGGAFLWCLVIIVVVSLLPGLIGGLFAAAASGTRNVRDAAALMESPEFGRAMIPWMIFGQVLSISIASVVLLRNTKPATVRRIGLRPPSIYHGMLSILALPGIMVVATGVDGLIRPVLPRFVDVEGSLAMMAAWPWYIAVLVVGLGPGIGEELWFRAFMGRGLVARHGVVGGVLLTSILFGLVHLDPRHAVVAATIGIFLHLIYLATGSLWVPMLMHTLNNTVAILSLGGGGPNFIDATAAEVPWTVYVATAGLLGAIGWGLYRTRVRSSEGPRLDLDPRLAPAESTADMSRASWPDAGGWIVPLAAACLFAGFTIRASVEYHRKWAPFHPEVPSAAEVNAMLRDEPFSAATWPAWSKRLRTWLPDKSTQLEPVFDEAREFLAQEFVRGNPRPPMRDDAMAWYLHGRGMLRMMNDPQSGVTRGRAAEPYLRRSIELDPAIGRAHYALAVAIYLQAIPANMQNPRFAEARQEAAFGEQLDPTTSAKAAEAWSAMVHQRYNHAERLYREIVNERPRDKSWRDALDKARSAGKPSAYRRR